MRHDAPPNQTHQVATKLLVLQAHHRFADAAPSSSLQLLQAQQHELRYELRGAKRLKADRLGQETLTHPQLLHLQNDRHHVVATRQRRLTPQHTTFQVTGSSTPLPNVCIPRASRTPLLLLPEARVVCHHACTSHKASCTDKTSTTKPTTNLLGAMS